jgi:DNA invertase Pin-like site-specific DNA recombinase
MNSAISEQHLNRTAYVYVRQSTLAQVRHHQESTERQYALRQKALELGWREPSVQVLDRDLGKSGAQTAGREDFKTLVAEVSMGQVGAVFALEVSRLAHSNLDWHRLLELCALNSTLVIDEDGCYNPADFNDGLLLGLKGTMAQAELHLLRGRLLGGKLNKARKGELRFPLPVGLCYDEDGRIVLDPDEEVQGDDPIFKSGFILLPCHAIDSGRSLTLKRVKAVAEKINVEMVEQGCEQFLLSLLCCFSHTVQSLGHAFPALCRLHVELCDVLLHLCPSLPSLRRSSCFLVRLVHRYYGTV